MTRYFIFAIASLSFLLVSVSATTIAVAFPVIADDFGVSLVLAGWVLTINHLTATVCMPLGGKAGEVFGVKRVYLFSLAIFITGSLVCAMAPNVTVLILGRFAQAIGHGMLLPVLIAIVADAFPEARQRAIGFFTSTLPISNVIGPIIGGWMVQDFGWRSVFWLSIPLCLIMFFLSLKFFKAGKGEGGQIDLIGTGYFAGALSALLVALSTLGDVKDGGSWLLPGALFVATAVFFVFFIRREGRVDHPVIEPYFLKKRPFLEVNIFSLLFGVVALGVTSFVPLFATTVYGMTTLQSGLILTPRAIGIVTSSMITSYFLPCWGYRRPMLTGIGIIIISLFLLGLEPSGLNMLGFQFNASFLLVFSLFLSGAGTGITSPAANNACLDLMPERIGTMTGLRGMFRQSGGASSITVVTLVLHYFSDMRLGFKVIYWGLALIVATTIPLIFSMPRSPNDPRWAKKAATPAP